MVRSLLPSWRGLLAGLAALVVGVVVASALVGEAPPTAEPSAAEASSPVSGRQLREPGASRQLGTPVPTPEPLGPDALAFVDPYETGPGTATGSDAPGDLAAESNAGETGPATSAVTPSDSTPRTTTPATTTAPRAGESANSPTTTAAPAATTREARPTTTLPAPTADAPALEIRQFTDWPIRNTNMDGRTQFTRTPANQLNWQQFTENSDRAIQLGSVTANKHLGQFRTQCSFSHFAYDDPLVLPGQPGAAHLHMFFGNTETNAHSTYRSLRDRGSSTCNGLEGNRTGYWVPAVFDAGGNARIPSRIEVYYKSHDRAFNNAEKPPEGLGMVAGNASNNPNIEWACQETGAQGTNLNRPVQQRQNTIPRCSGTATLLAHIKFPQCLRGAVGVNSGNNTGQLSYPTRGFFTNSCPAGTQYITAIEYFIAWNPDNHDGNTDQWWLSSDVRADNGERVANGSTLHGDWFGGWNPELMDQIHANCVGRLAECSWDLVDNNQRLTWVEHFGQRHTTAYRGRRTVSAAELSEALCPSDTFSVATDAAHCSTRKGTAVGGVSVTADDTTPDGGDRSPGSPFGVQETRSNSAGDDYVPFCSLLPSGDSTA